MNHKVKSPAKKWSNTIFEFNYSADNVICTRQQIIEFMGYTDDVIPQPVDESITYVLQSLTYYLQARGGFIIYPDVYISKDGFNFRELDFNCGSVIAKNLKNAEAIAFFAVTVGPGMDFWSKKAGLDGEMMHSYTIDCTGSIIAENIADRINEQIHSILPESSLRLTNRYSPGYCGWNVAEQVKLFSLLPEQFCGITLTSSSLMIPIKSVSGIIGIGKEVQFNRYSCNECHQKNCLMNPGKKIEQGQ